MAKKGVLEKTSLKIKLDDCRVFSDCNMQRMIHVESVVIN